MDDSRSTKKPHLAQPPLLVDLDGSFLSSDTLYETFFLLLKKNPFYLFPVIYWLLQGKQQLKKYLYENTSLNIQQLPYNPEVVEYLKQAHTSGRRIILCTGSWHELASKIAANFDFFETVIASNDSVNLTGKAKLAYLQENFSDTGFDYLGNENKDLIVWQHANAALVVGSFKLKDKAEKITTVEHHFVINKPSIKTLLKAIRIHQWAKNALLFVPIATAHQLLNAPAMLEVILAFLSFSFCASATYLLNDLFDLESDRKHPTKCNRPLASGNLSIPSGILLGCFLMLIGLIASWFVNVYFLLILILYIALTVLYSFKLKSLQTVDVVTLASLFTLRVIAGGTAISVELSFWLLNFSMFMFLSLAIVKRLSELIRVEQEKGLATEKISGRGYYPSDITILQSLGGSSGFLSVLVFALYINSVEVVQLYTHPQILWLICPVLGYWIMRIWMLSARGEMNEDPISFAITDRNSWYSALFMFLIFSTASWV